MRQLAINSSCNGCGLCIVKCKYIEENEDGNAQVVRGMAIKKEDEKEIEEVINCCPEKAISIIETGAASKKGKDGVKEIIADLKKKCEMIKVDKPESALYRFRAKDYDLSIPSTNKDLKYSYSSESSAKSAAKDEFRRLCYSSSACKPMVKKIFVEYKVEKLKPFYDTEDQPETYYYKYNEQVRKYLADAYAEVCGLLGEDALDDSWAEFSCYLSEKKSDYVGYLKNFDEKSEEYDVISMIEKNSRDYSFPGIEQYLVELDYDSMEECAGIGLFGNMKYKDKWNFTGFNAAAKEFIGDVYSQLDYVDDEIVEMAEDYISGACMDYEEAIKEKFSKKISQLENIIA